jgi:hypothetical protein
MPGVGRGRWHLAALCPDCERFTGKEAGKKEVGEKIIPNNKTAWCLGVCSYITF